MFRQKQNLGFSSTNWQKLTLILNMSPKKCEVIEN